MPDWYLRSCFKFCIQGKYFIHLILVSALILILLPKITETIIPSISISEVTLLRDFQFESFIHNFIGCQLHAMQSYRYQDPRYTVLVLTKRTPKCDWQMTHRRRIKKKKNLMETDDMHWRIKEKWSTEWLGRDFNLEVRDSLSKKVHLMLISEYSRSSHTHT